MAMFDPKNRPKPDNKDLPASDYLLVLKSFERRSAKGSNKPYLRGRFLIIHGPAKGKSFFDSISLDTDNSGAMFRLSLLSEQCGVTEPFDLDDDNILRAKLCGRPFKATVNRKISGEYVNNGIQRYITKVSDSEREVMERWLIEKQEEDEFNGGGHRDGGNEYGMPDDGVPPPGDDDFMGGGGRRGGRGDGGAGGGYDDIPF